MADVDSTMQRYYAARAAEYDRIYAKPERQSDLRKLEQMLPPIFAGRRTLEIACGTGYWTQWIAPAAREMVAIDAAPETLEIARRRISSRAVVFRVGDAYELPQDLRPFDAVFAGFWFSHVPRRRWRAFLAGLQPRLNRGAEVVLLDNLYVEGSSTPISDRDDDGNTYQNRTLDDGSRHRVLKNFPSESELREAVAGVAVDCRFVAFDYYWLFRYTASPLA